MTLGLIGDDTTMTGAMTIVLGTGQIAIGLHADGLTAFNAVQTIRVNTNVMFQYTAEPI